MESPLLAVDQVEASRLNLAWIQDPAERRWRGDDDSYYLYPLVFEAAAASMERARASWVRFGLE